jgi:hypothetical protein
MVSCGQPSAASLLPARTGKQRLLKLNRSIACDPLSASTLTLEAGCRELGA